MYFQNVVFSALTMVAAIGVSGLEHGKVPYYTAHMQPIAGSNWTAHGLVNVFVNDRGGVSGTAVVEGMQRNLGENKDDCTLKNACGAHIHTGYDCSTAATQGEHLFEHTKIDPWANVRFPGTNGFGAQTFSFFNVAIHTKDVGGRAFIFHGNNGERIACGLLKEL